MPRRSLLTPTECLSLLAFPTDQENLIRHYTFGEPEMAVIRQRRGAHRVNLNKRHQSPTGFFIILNP